jgi:hypothetical protein
VLNVLNVVNVVAFQIGWFAAVLGAAHGAPWLGVLVVPLVLGLHLALSPDWRPELAIAASAGAIGFVFDTALVAMGVFSPVFFLLAAPLSPPWMVMLWINFSTTLNRSLGSLRGRYILAAILGAVGGPAAYYSGARLGAMTVLPTGAQLLVLAAAWAVAVPLLFRLSARIHEAFRS